MPKLCYPVTFGSKLQKKSGIVSSIVTYSQLFQSKGVHYAECLDDFPLMKQLVVVKDAATIPRKSSTNLHGAATVMRSQPGALGARTQPQRVLQWNIYVHCGAEEARRQASDVTMGFIPRPRRHSDQSADSRAWGFTEQIKIKRSFTFCQRPSRDQ